MTSSANTIFALATAPGRSAIAVLRVTGPDTRRALTALIGRLPPPRRASLRQLRRPEDGTVLDQGVILWFPAPGSFTGEDGGELHLHGGAAVVEAVSRALRDLGLRDAEPGEFTRRAFERGRLDLSQAEAVADLVDAETDNQRRQALAQLGGELTARHARWRERLIEALAGLEAAIDFPDEDLPIAVAEQARAPLEEVARDLDAALVDGIRGERVREGYRIALIGAPNAGKSSLLNALARSNTAIVTAIPGTTRDVIEVVLDLGGFRVLLADTAGLRETGDPIELEGVRRATERAERSDLRIVVVDGAGEAEGDWRGAAALARPGDLCLLNKADLPRGDVGGAADLWARSSGVEVMTLSLVTGDGLEALDAALAERVARDLSGGEFPAATRARHRADLAEALVHLRRGLKQLEAAVGPELAAEDVRLAARCLARVGGRVDGEQVLDRVFSRFCIGK